MTERRSIELGGITVDLLRIGTFRSDAGAIFGPVPQETWAPMVAGEIDARSRLLQALNILHVSDANGGVLLETGAVPAGALVRDADTDSQSAREALVAAGLGVALAYLGSGWFQRERAAAVQAREAAATASLVAVRGQCGDGHRLLGGPRGDTAARERQRR